MEAWTEVEGEVVEGASIPPLEPDNLMMTTVNQGLVDGIDDREAGAFSLKDLRSIPYSLI